MTDRRGAFGLVVDVPEVPVEWWVEAPEHWVPWSFVWACDGQHSRGATPAGPCIETSFDGGTATFSPVQRTTTFFADRAPDPAEMVHPLFGETASLHATLEGWNPFHAGGFVVDGRVWALLGARERGKSSALAWMHEAGIAVFGDDMVVVDAGQALAGPRSLDLRRGAAEHFGIGADVGVVGARPRWRVLLPPVPAELPIAGFVQLEWSDGETVVERLKLADALRCLAAARAVIGPPGATSHLLHLATLPTIKLRRPQRWSAADASMSILLDAVSGA